MRTGHVAFLYCRQRPCIPSPADVGVSVPVGPSQKDQSYWSIVRRGETLPPSVPQSVAGCVDKIGHWVAGG